MRNIAEVTTAVAAGDLSKKITVDVKGEILELKNTINTMVDQLRSFAAEVTRVAREVGTEGKLGGQADVQGVAGTWKDLTDSVNSMASNLTVQLRDVSKVATAIAGGDLTQKITVDVRGEIRQIKDVINTMVDQLSSFAAEVTRVAREVGTEGKLGGQAQVKGVSGTWKDLTDNVNFMAGNLTSQVRGIAKVVTAVANGDLAQKLTVDAKGEIAALAETINSMTDTLATFADQVTTVAREVGVEGKLGGQAKVPGAAGTWKGLTENVNQLAENLTTQVRAIAEVATAVTKGDLTRSITVQAQGEVAALKDTINEMISNLRDTTQKNTEQDWLKTNLAKFSRMLQGQKDLVAVSQMILSELAPVVGAHMAEFYVLDHSAEQPRLKLLASYASSGQSAHGKVLDLGMGLVGQCAHDKQKILLADLSHNTLRISSGLIEAMPRAVLVLPVIFEGQVKGVIELGSLKRFNPTHQAFLDLLTESIGIVINTIEANMRTEELLKQSQSLANELQSRQRELQTTNRELQEKAQLLAHQNQEVERKNQEVEQARQALEEKAKQLALTSKYKSEFLANMSHELRTPLNSLLILSDQLCKNREGNLHARQIEFARTIHASGNDLLTLINDILDLAKIESGTVVVDLTELLLKDLHVYVERTFRYVAEAKNVEFSITIDGDVGPALVTDSKRLQQILKNLLSNAFKFTHDGEVSLTITPAESGWSEDHEELNKAQKVVAFVVSDSGIGISPDKQQIIFEAFQQADGSTSRKYGGTGLGLAISRELSRLLGGEIRLQSRPGEGSTFTLYLPTVPSAARQMRARAAATDAVPLSEARARVPVLANQPIIVPGAIRTDAQDDRGTIVVDDRVLLIVENDPGFANVLLEIARDRGFKGLIAAAGSEAQSLIRRFNPAAITLDIHLPDMEGWQILRQVKADIAYRHVPVCVISTDESREDALELGAYSFVAKPIRSRDQVEQALDTLITFATAPKKELLIASTSPKLREAWREALNGEDVVVAVASTPASVLKRLQESDYACIVLDGSMRLEPGEIARALSNRQRTEHLPVVVHEGRGATVADHWKSFADRLTLWPVRTETELQDQTALVLHRSVFRLPEAQRQTVLHRHKVDAPLEGKKVLIVDDDMRNIFALAAVLEEHGMEITSADNGREALDILTRRSDLDVVLMDIMMPEMDGIATMKAARKLSAGQKLPIIAVTAKAMKGDRERCIAAGASDYLSKPIDTAHLLHVLRSWLHM